MIFQDLKSAMQALKRNPDVRNVSATITGIQGQELELDAPVQLPDREAVVYNNSEVHHAEYINGKIIVKTPHKFNTQDVVRFVYLCRFRRGLGIEIRDPSKRAGIRTVCLGEDLPV